MDFADFLWGIERDVCEMRFHGGHEFGVKRGNEVIIVLLLRRMGKCIPWEFVDIPRM
jgi:hypothetical protein